MGNGARKVLALHCTIGFSGAWRALVGNMEECTFVAPDMLSHGASPDWDRNGDFQDRMVEAVLPFLSERMDVIGHSFGGTVALRLAVEYPELVRSVTMIEPVLFAIAALDDPEALDRQQRDARPVFEAFEEGDEVLAARRFNRMWGDDNGLRWDDLPDQTRNAMIRGIHVVQASGSAVMDRAGLLTPERLALASMPALLIRGALCHQIVPVVNDGLARRLAQGESVVVAGAGHMVPVSHPAETAAHIRSVFARTD